MSTSGSDSNNNNASSQTSKSTQSLGKPNTQPQGYASALKSKPPVPLRTSSAPPEDHLKLENSGKSHFVPTKTGPLTSTTESSSTTLNFRSVVTKKENTSATPAETTATISSPTVITEVVSPVMSQQDAPSDPANTAVNNTTGSSEDGQQQGQQSNANNNGVEYRAYDNNRPRNNNQRGRSGSGSYQGNYGAGRGGNRAGQQPPQMTLPQTQQTQQFISQQQQSQQQQLYATQPYYQTYPSNFTMDPESNTYYSSCFMYYFQQYKMQNFDDSVASQYAQHAATQVAAAYFQQKFMTQQQQAQGYVAQGMVAQQQQPGVYAMAQPGVVVANSQQQMVYAQQQQMQQQQMMQAQQQQQQQPQYQQVAMQAQQQQQQAQYQQVPVQQQPQQQQAQPVQYAQVVAPAATTAPVAANTTTTTTTTTAATPVSATPAATTAPAAIPAASTAASVPTSTSSGSLSSAAASAQPFVPQSVLQAAAAAAAADAMATASTVDAATTPVVPVSAPSTPAVPTMTIVPPTAKKLVIKRKTADGEQVEVDLQSLKSERTAPPAAAPATTTATTTSTNAEAEVTAVTTELAEKLSVQTDLAHQPGNDGPASWEATPVLPGKGLGAPPALQKVGAASFAATAAAPPVVVPSSSSRPNSRVYTRQQIMDLKPAVFEPIPMYTVGVTSNGEVTPDGRRGGGGGYGGNKGGQGGARGGEYRDRGDRNDNNNNNNNNNNRGNRGDRNNNNNNREGGGEDWQKERLSPKQVPTKPNIPFKKDVKNDPLAALEVDATEIINKITPETFEKLSKKTLELKVVNTTMLDALVKLIFEAAVTQAGFSSVFADLCVFLAENAVEWNFFTVVKDAEKDEYFWIRDVSFPEEYAGPFFEKSAISAAIGSSAPMKALPGQNLSSLEVLLIDNHLVRMGKNMSEAYLITYLPSESFPAENRSQNVFPDEISAKKDASTQVSFRACLAQNCEREFNASVQDENLYDGVDEQLQKLRARRATMTETEFEREEQGIEEQRMKIKRRMLGNIKFVGELYKRKLLNTDTMHYCITKLIGEPDNWKQTHDEQDLELLLHLLTTLGETLESKSKKSKNKELGQKFDKYFERLEQLRRDMSLPSRIRFGIDDLVKLHDSNWQGKKVAEGPMKLNELHSKIQEDQKAAAVAANQKTNGGGNNNNNNNKGVLSGKGGNNNNSNAGGGRGGPQDVRASSGKNAAPAPAGGKNSSSNYNASKNAPAATKPAADNNNKKPAAAGGRGNADRTAPAAASAAASTTTTAAAAAAAATAVSAEPEVYEFNSKALRGKANESLDEYLNGVDVSEVVLTMNERGAAFQGQMIIETLEKLLNLSDVNKRKKLLELTEHADVLAEYTRSREAVKQAVESYDNFKNLVDTLVDIKEAPERIAALIAVLIRGNVLTETWVVEMVGRFHVYNVDQNLNMPEDIDATFDRFKNVLKERLN